MFQIYQMDGIQFIIIYAMGWNIQRTVWLNHRTSFQPSSWMSGALYAKLTLTSYPNKLLDNNDGHQWRLHAK